MGPVLPVLVPEVVGVGGGEDEGGDDAAKEESDGLVFFEVVRV